MPDERVIEMWDWKRLGGVKCGKAETLFVFEPHLARINLFSLYFSLL